MGHFCEWNDMLFSEVLSTEKTSHEVEVFIHKDWGKKSMLSYIDGEILEINSKGHLIQTDFISSQS